MEHIEGRFRGYKNLNLYYQCWLPEREPKAILLVVHGICEHSGRYTNLANLQLTSYGGEVLLSIQKQRLWYFYIVYMAAMVIHSQATAIPNAAPVIT